MGHRRVWKCARCGRQMISVWVEVAAYNLTGSGNYVSTLGTFCSTKCLTDWAAETAAAKKVEPSEVDELPDGEVEDCFTDEEGVKRDCDVGNYRECERCTRKIVST